MSNKKSGGVGVNLLVYGVVACLILAVSALALYCIRTLFETISIVSWLIVGRF